MSRLRRVLAAAALLLPLSIFAAPVSAPSALGGLVESHTAAGQQTVNIGGIDFDNRGRPLDSRGIPTVETDGSAAAKTTNTGNLKNPSGNPVPVRATGRIPPKAAAKAIGKALVKIAPTGYLLGVGVAIYDLAKELGFTLGRNPDGSLKVEKEDPEICTVAPCFSYRAYIVPSEGSQPSGSINGAVANYLSWANSASPQWRWELNGPFNPTTMQQPIKATLIVGSPLGEVSYNSLNIARTPADPQPATSVPSTDQEFLDAIAAKSGWPSGSDLARTLEEAAKITGEKIEPENLTVIGPETTPGTTSTTQKPDGSTETATTTHNHTYNNNNVTTTTTTVINNYNPTTNTTTTETRTETPPKEEEQPEYDVTDTPLPEQPKLYTPKYPNGLEGVWAQQKANLTSTPLANLVSRLMPSVGTSGTCPVMNIDFNLAGWADFGVRDVAPPCYVWDWGRLIILVSALLLARALIFGG